MSSRRAQKEAARRQRLEAERAARGRAARLRRLRIAGAAAIALAAAVAVGLVASAGHSSAAPLASTRGEASGAPVDGIRCEAAEQVLFHVHAHLAVYVDGRRRVVPEGIGIPPPRAEQQTPAGPFVTAGRCFYWLHSHTRDGIVHIESPVQRTFTLGNYFDIWGQPLGPRRVGPAAGPVTAFVDGRRFDGDPRTIPLRAHEVIQLDVGTVVRPLPFTFPAGL
jgi:hypothetical protein